MGVAIVVERTKKIVENVTWFSDLKDVSVKKRE